MTSPSTVFSRTCFLVFLCVALLGWGSTLLLCLALERSPLPFHDPLVCRVFSPLSSMFSFAFSFELICSCIFGTTRGFVSSVVISCLEVLF